jgi:hypothetical protein
MLIPAPVAMSMVPTRSAVVSMTATSTWSRPVRPA